MNKVVTIIALIAFFTAIPMAVFIIIQLSNLLIGKEFNYWSLLFIPNLVIVFISSYRVIKHKEPIDILP
jgi:hypothetical protein